MRKRRSNQITTKPHTEWTGKKAHHKTSGELKSRKKQQQQQRLQHTVARDTLPADSSAYDFLKFRLVAGQALSRLHVYFAPIGDAAQEIFLVILLLLFSVRTTIFWSFRLFETCCSCQYLFIVNY